VKMRFDHVVGNRPRAAVDHKNRIVGQCNPRVRRPNSLALGGLVGSRPLSLVGFVCRGRRRHIISSLPRSCILAYGVTS
jgi:hypothetical protein